MTLPVFAYHPDPVATGSVIESAEACARCGLARGWVYRGPLYSRDRPEAVCPWCVADGSAAERFGAAFTTVDGAPDDVPAAVLDEVLHRTVGFSGWQQERWMFHCADAAAYLGRAGWDELEGLPDAVESLVVDGGARDVLPYLHRDGDATAYLFRCRHCGTHVASWDSG